VDHRRVSLSASANGVQAPVEHQPAMEVEYCLVDGPQVHGHWEISCPEDGDVVIMDQRPVSVAGHYIGHWLLGQWQ